MEFVRDLSGALNRLGTRRNLSVNIAMTLCRKAKFSGISNCISTKLLKPGAMDQPRRPILCQIPFDQRIPLKMEL